MSEAPIYVPEMEQIAQRARPAHGRRDAEHRVLRAAFSAEKVVGAKRTADLLRTVADALESGRTPLFT